MVSPGPTLFHCESKNGWVLRKRSEGVHEMVDFDHMANQYARHRGADSHVLAALTKTIAHMVSPKVLEVGCGTGNYVRAVQEITQASCWGIDPSEKMLSFAKSRTQHVDLQIGTGESLSYEDGFFSFVYCVHVMHQVQDRSQCVQESYRVLQRGGSCCVVTHADALHRAVPTSPLGVYFPEAYATVQTGYPTSEELVSVMRQSGFTNIWEEIVESSMELKDATAYRDKAMSPLLGLEEEAFLAGLKNLEAALKNGPIQYVARNSLLWGTKL